MTPTTNVRSTLIDKGVVPLDVSSCKIGYSNPVGSRVWIKLQEGLPLSKIVDEISAECNAPREQVEAAVREYIQSLKTRGIIEDRTGL